MSDMAGYAQGSQVILVSSGILPICPQGTGPVMVKTPSEGPLHDAWNIAELESSVCGPSASCACYKVLGTQMSRDENRSIVLSIDKT